MSVNCCNPECIHKILTINEINNSNPRKLLPNSTYTNIDLNILPKNLYSDIINRKTKNIISACEQKPSLFKKVYNLDNNLKRAGDMAGRNRLGCCYKLEWIPQSSNRVLSFNQLLNLNRYRIRFWETSNVNWLINTVLTTYRKHMKAKKFISNSKYYPVNNLVINKSFSYTDRFDKLKNNGLIKSGCNNLKKLDYINWLKYKGIFNS